MSARTSPPTTVPTDAFPADRPPTPNDRPRRLRHRRHARHRTPSAAASPSRTGSSLPATVDKTVLKMTDKDWYKVISVNLSGAFFMSQAALPHMIERGTGRIINISSVVGSTGNIGQANYAASKSGLFGLTKTVAREAAFQLQLAGKLSEDSIGLTVNAVAPGFIAHRDARAHPGEGARSL